MALSGTLKDFGIADILQLIGQQQKTGNLFMKAKDEEIAIAFYDGNIVKAESSVRNKKDLIGNMLVRAELITQHQLDQALEIQKRSLQRLGDVLINAKALDEESFKKMVRLQTTETLYRLFSWTGGTYEFEQRQVEYEANVVAPLRAESVLMEGFRMVDEWPLIRKKIATYQMTFETLKALPPPSKKKEEDGPDQSGLTDYDRSIYKRIAPERDVRKLIDIGCIGEFETCKSLSNLVDKGYVRSVAPAGRGEALAGARPPWERLGGLLGRVGLTMVVMLGLGFVVSRLDFQTLGLTAGPSSSYADPAAQRFISRQQLTRIEAALDIYRLEKGHLPEKLEALVDTGLLGGEDLRYPWRDSYYYRRTEQAGFVLLPPLR